MAATLAWVVEPSPAFLALSSGAWSLLGVSWLGRVALGGLTPSDLASVRLTEAGVRRVPLMLHRPWWCPSLTCDLSAQGDCVRVPMQWVTASDEPTSVRIEATMRGRETRAELLLESSAPFGLLNHRRRVAISADTWVFPAARVVRDHVLRDLMDLRPSALDHAQPAGPGDAEFHSLREFREGDPERRVHPRISARRGRKVVRILRGDAPPRFHLVLDQRVPVATSAFERTDFEEAVRFAAGVVRSILRQEIPLQLSLCDRTGLVDVVSTQSRDPQAYFAALALARADARREGDRDEPSLPPPTHRGRGLVVHLGTFSADTLPHGWIGVRAGSTTFYRLLEPQIR